MRQTRLLYTGPNLLIAGAPTEDNQSGQKLDGEFVTSTVRRTFSLTLVPEPCQ